MQRLNETNITIILKKKNPTSITKSLATRIKDMLHLVVAEYQIAFILARLITDNVMVLYEIIQHLKWKRR